MKMVLLVEDEIGHAEVMQMLLETEGYRVAVAANGREALGLLEREKPAVILSDFMMPVMHGAALGSTVRSDAALRDIPFVIISGTSEEVVRQAFEDYDAFLPKPFDVASLVILVARLIDRGRPSPSEDVKRSMVQLLQGIRLPPEFDPRRVYGFCNFKNP